MRRFDIEDLDMMAREVERLGLDDQAEYRPLYRGILVEMMEKGHTYEAVAGGLGVSMETLQRWEEEHEDWLHAKKVGFGLALRYWEIVLNDTATGKAEKGKANAIIFKLQSTFDSLYENKSGSGAAPVQIFIDTGIKEPEERDVSAPMKESKSFNISAKKLEAPSEERGRASDNESSGHPKFFEQKEIIILDDL